MPLTSKGRTIMASYKKQYGEKEGERKFYASKNAGTISGVDTKPGAGRNDQATAGQPQRMRGSPSNFANATDFVVGSTSPRPRR